MIYIQYDENNVVNLINHKPEELNEEEIAKGILVDSIPEVDENMLELGKSAILTINTNNTLFYQYIDRPLTEQERIQQLEDMVANLLLVTSGGVL